MVYFLVKRIGDFKFSTKNIKNIFLYGFFTVLMILNVTFLKGYIQYGLSSVFILIVGIKSLDALNQVYNFKNKFKKSS